MEALQEAKVAADREIAANAAAIAAQNTKITQLTNKVRAVGAGKRGGEEDMRCCSAVLAMLEQTNKQTNKQANILVCMLLRARACVCVCGCRPKSWRRCGMLRRSSARRPSKASR